MNSSDSKKKSVLVTGGAGFIGAHMALHLLKKNLNVVVLDDLSGGFKENVPQGAEFIQGSILDRDLLKKLFEQHRFDYVYHLAAYAAEGLSPFIRHFNYQNNLIGSINLINLSIEYDVERFVFSSSIAVYGEGQLPMRESLKPHPEDPYGVSKYAVELDLECARRTHGLRYTIFRPHNVYGEFQNIGDRYRNVIGIFMNRIMQAETLSIFGDGCQTRAFSYITDVAVPMVDCLENPKTIGEVFNVGADQAYSVNDLAKTVIAAMAPEFKAAPIQYLEARKEVLHAYSTHEKVHQFFPHLSKAVTLEDGIRKMAAWAKKSGLRKTDLFMGVELYKGMPDSWQKEFSR